VASEDRSVRSKLVNALSCLLALICLTAIAAPAQASSGIWNRAWGLGVNGGSAFGICTVAAHCQAGINATPAVGGEFAGASAVGTDSAGNVYVAESNNSRIQKFDSSGNFLRAWGKNVNGGVGDPGICTVAASCQAGTQGGVGGQFSNPNGIATDSTGNVYVADSDNNRIQKFDSSGNFLRAWGKNVNGGAVFGICTVAASCQAGTTGGLGGDLSFPIGIATDSGGNVYVAESNNSRIQKFDSSGNFLRAWGKNVNGGAVFGICTVAASCQQGTVGSLGGEFNAPDGLATDAAGNVYTSDFTGHRIQKFDSSGSFLRAWGKNVNGVGGFGICTVASSCQAGTAGTRGGELYAPTHLATDGAANVYVADEGNSRIQKFDSSGNFLSAWGKGVNGGGAFGVCTVAASCQSGLFGALGGELSDPVAVGSDAAGNVYVADFSDNRVQKFRADAAGSTPPPGAGSTPSTGRRAAALKKCKKQHKKTHSKKKFKKCKKKANLLPV
jgi:tripartite motif-containing protein 71